MTDGDLLAGLGEAKNALFRAMEQFSEPLTLYEVRMRFLRISRKFEGQFEIEFPSKQQKKLFGVFDTLILSVCRKFRETLPSLKKKELGSLFNLLELMERLLRERENMLVDIHAVSPDFLDELEKRYPELVEDIRKHYHLYPYEGLGMITPRLLELIEKMAGEEEGVRFKKLAGCLRDPEKLSEEFSEELSEELRKTGLIVNDDGVVLRLDGAIRRIEKIISKGEITVDAIRQAVGVSTQEAEKLRREAMLRMLYGIIETLQSSQIQTVAGEPAKEPHKQEESREEPYKPTQNKPTKEKKRKTTPLH